MPKMKVTEKSEKLHKLASQALQESRAQQQWQRQSSCISSMVSQTPAPVDLGPPVITAGGTYSIEVKYATSLCRND